MNQSQSTQNSCQAALIVMQQAVKKLLTWSKADVAPNFPYPSDNRITQTAKEIIGIKWGENTEIQALRLLFDKVNLDQQHNKEHYWKPIAIANEKPPVPYPTETKPDNFDDLKDEIKTVSLDDQSWQNLSLLTLIVEKFGSFISWGKSDIAFCDLVKSTAAVASAIAHNPETQQLSLIGGDLSGIQSFIYTISSDGALKSLRARSFFLELVTEEIVQRLLKKLKLPRTNVIYAGGGNLFILAPSQQEKELATIIEETRDSFNEWLFNEFQGKVFLALDFHEFDIKAISTAKFADEWSVIPQELGKQKAQKFSNKISDVLEPKPAYNSPCQVCHRDDLPENQLDLLKKDEPDSAIACGMCNRMFRLGGQLLKVRAILRSRNLGHSGFRGSLRINGICYYLLDSEHYQVQDGETLLLVNDWNIENYPDTSAIPLLLGNYGAKSTIEEEPGIMSAREMSDKAQGIKRVGYLRMDVDKLGQIFAKGLGNLRTLTRITGLSRLMTYFFKVYLNQLAEFRQENTPDFLKLTHDLRTRLLFIYAGGDDVFISGSWNEVVEFSFDLYQAFRAYTGYNPNITLSAGVTLAGAKFPLYQAAEQAGDAEEKAKGNDRDSLTLFDCTFKWHEWLGKTTHSDLKPDIQQYLQAKHQPHLLGIFPLVTRINNTEYNRAFIRNLLATAQLQEQAVKDAEKQKKSERHQNDLKYFLHLPKVAYTLARLPSKTLKSSGFEDVRQSLKSPYNAPYFRAIATWIELLNREY